MYTICTLVKPLQYKQLVWQGETTAFHSTRQLYDCNGYYNPDLKAHCETKIGQIYDMKFHILYMCP